MFANKFYNKIYYVYMVISIMAMFVYNFPESLDIQRYFNTAAADVKIYRNVIEYAQFQIGTHIDFIYFCVLYILESLGWSLVLFTMAVLFLYYKTIIDIGLFAAANKKLYNVYVLLLCLVFCCAPLVTIISVSRTTFACVFLFMAIIFYFRKKYLFTLTFFILSLFSHFSMALPISMLILSFIFSKVEFLNKINGKVIPIFIIIGLSTPLLFKGFVSTIIPFFADTHYSVYEDSFDTGSIFKMSNISIGDKLIAIYLLAVGVYCCIKDANRNFMYWMLVLIMVLWASFINSTIQMIFRFEVILPPFLIYSLCSIISKNKNSRVLCNIINFSSIFITIIYLYTVRQNFF